MSYAIKQSFSKSKKFGDKLEKDFALRVIKQMHPGCTIKSPDDAGIFREDGNAIPDHCVMKGKKPITFYDSKRKNKLYSQRWSTDEKLLQYREIAKKYGVPCYLIFYCENHDKKNVYIVDVMVEPKFHKEVNNQRLCTDTICHRQPPTQSKENTQSTSGKKIGIRSNMLDQ